MNHILAKYPIANAVEQIILDMISGPTSYWKQTFRAVVKEITFRADYPLAHRVESVLNRIPKTVLLYMSRRAESDTEITYDLDWLDDRSLYKISIIDDNSIVVDGWIEYYHCEYAYRHGCLGTMACPFALGQYGRWMRTQSIYMITFDTIDLFNLFIANEIKAALLNPRSPK
jgi:hypothetical protein